MDVNHHCGSARDVTDARPRPTKSIIHGIAWYPWIAITHGWCATNATRGVVLSPSMDERGYSIDADPIHGSIHKSGSAYSRMSKRLFHPFR